MRFITGFCQNNQTTNFKNMYTLIDFVESENSSRYLGLFSIKICTEV